jgi:transcription termination factor Rho
LKQLAEQDVPISGAGVLEVLQDGFGFCALLRKTIFPGRMIFMFLRRKSAVLVCEQGDIVEGKSAPQKNLNVILLCSKSIALTGKPRKKSGIASTLIT